MEAKEKEITRIGDLTGNRFSHLPRKTLEDVEGQDLLIMDFDLRQGQNGEYAIIACHDASNEDFVVVTGANAVLDALKRAKDYLPLPGKFIRQRSQKGRRYWTLV